jgi:hypothetical protein
MRIFSGHAEGAEAFLFLDMDAFLAMSASFLIWCPYTVVGGLSHKKPGILIARRLAGGLPSRPAWARRRTFYLESRTGRSHDR